MATLGIYKEVKAGTYKRIMRISGETDSTLLPLVLTHDGVDGGVIETRLFVRAEKTSEYYQNITIQPVSTTVVDDVGGSTGWGVKLAAGSISPTELQWEATSYGNIISISNIGSTLSGDINTYRPFWCRVECPANAAGGPKVNIALELNCTAYPVGV